MSLAEQYHAEHKARLARMGRDPKFVTTTTIEPVKRSYIPIRPRSNVRPHPHNYYWSKMWFWDLVNPRPIAASGYQPPVKRIIEVVARHYGVSSIDIVSERRTADVVFPRQMVMYLARKITAMSMPQIGNAIGKRDHTTVLHGAKKIKKYLAKYDELEAVIEKLEMEIGAI